MPLELLREAIRQFKAGFIQVYGMTETTGTIVMLPPEDHDPNGNKRMRSAGKPLPGVEIKVIDDAGNEVPTGEVGEVITIEYKARDGLTIPALITWPVGVAADQRKNLPMIVMPHGGPESYDSVGFDWLAQFLANEGYIVLQPNFRGSGGFGVSASVVIAQTSASSRSGERPDERPSRPKSHISSSSAGKAPTCLTRPCS